jgi:hypothetical protein
VRGEVRRGFIELVAKVRASQLVLSVTLLHITIARRKVKMCRFSSGNWFFLLQICSAKAGKKAKHSCAPAAREECNKYDLTW